MTSMNFPARMAVTFAAADSTGCWARHIAGARAKHRACMNIIFTGVLGIEASTVRRRDGGDLKCAQHAMHCHLALDVLCVVSDGLYCTYLQKDSPSIEPFKCREQLCRGQHRRYSYCVLAP